MKRTHNTSALIDMIMSSRKTVNDFATVVADLSGSNISTLKAHLHGFGPFSKDELTAMSLILSIPEDKINDNILTIEEPATKKSDKTNKESSATEKKNNIPTGDDPNDYYKVNYPALEKARIRAKFTQTGLAEKAGAPITYYKLWKEGRRISGKRATAIAKILNADFSALFTHAPLKPSKTEPVQANKEGGKTSMDNTVSRRLKPDMNKIQKLVKKKYGSQAAFLKKSGVSSSTFNLWTNGNYAYKKSAEKAAKALKVNISEIFTPVSEDSANETSNADNVKMTAVIPSNKPEVAPAIPLDEDLFKATPTDGILQVFDVFRVINNNLQGAYDSLAKRQDDAVKHYDAKIDALINEVASLREALAKTQEREDIVPETNEAKIIHIDSKIPTSKTLSPLKPKDTTYDPMDTLEQYMKKINKMVLRIAQDRDETKNSVLHEFYEEMHRTYGVVWEQLKKEYMDRHGSLHPASMALLYDNGMFGEIFFHLVQSAYKDIEKANKKRKLY